MLILTRRAGEAILLAGGIRVIVIATERGQVRLGIEAPPEVTILRQEIVDSITAGTVAAVATPEALARLGLSPAKAVAPALTPAAPPAAPPAAMPAGAAAQAGAPRSRRRAAASVGDDHIVRPSAVTAEIVSPSTRKEKRRALPSPSAASTASSS